MAGCGASVQGCLFKYGPGSIHSAFMTGQGRYHAVFVPGLTDGLLSHKYFKPLGEALSQNGWSLVQPLLTSSYTGWGMSSLEKDTDEMLMLTKCLGKDFGSQGVVLIGHSTGCQDAVRYTKRFLSDRDAPGVLGVILQGPVSDREFMALDPAMAALLPKAREMVAEGSGEEVLTRDIFGEGTPSFMSARRFVSLADRGGDDDMFSSDLSDTELCRLLGHLQATPTLLVLSGADEYVPESVDTKALAERLRAAAGSSAESVVLEGANHALEGHEAAAAEVMLSFCRRVQPGS